MLVSNNCVILFPLLYMEGDLKEEDREAYLSPDIVTCKRNPSCRALVCVVLLDVRSKTPSDLNGSEAIRWGKTKWKK